MATLAPFVERRSRARLGETPLRRRYRTPTQAERRRRLGRGFDIAHTLELNLDRYPTKPAMLTFLQSLMYAAEGVGDADWRPGYLEALRQAADVLHDAATAPEAVATLHGYQAFVARQQGHYH